VKKNSLIKYLNKHVKKIQYSYSNKKYGNFLYYVARFSKALGLITDFAGK
jgi:hypothetical protein